MKAINNDGQQIVNHAIETRVTNKLYIIDSLRASITYIKQHEFELAKEPLLKSYMLIHESLSCTFIAVKGLQPLVVNELSDSLNYNQLDNIYTRVYDQYESLFRLASENYKGKNIYSFLKYKILKDLTHLYSEILLIDLHYY